MIKAGEAVLKTDRLGRVQTPVARREQLLDEFERSGLSGIKYAAVVGIKYSTFATWMKRRRQRGATAGAPVKPVDSMRWLEAVVEQAQNPGAQNSAGLVLELPQWQAMAERLKKAGTAFVLEPQLRYPGQPGEQWTMFFCDPSGNPIEVKGFRSLAGLYAT